MFMFMCACACVSRSPSLSFRLSPRVCIFGLVAKARPTQLSILRVPLLHRKIGSFKRHHSPESITKDPNHQEIDEIAGELLVKSMDYARFINQLVRPSISGQPPGPPALLLPKRSHQTIHVSDRASDPQASPGSLGSSGANSS